MEQFGLKLLDPKEDDVILEISPGNGRLISEIMPHIEKVAKFVESISLNRL